MKPFPIDCFCQGILITATGNCWNKVLLKCFCCCEETSWPWQLITDTLNCVWLTAQRFSSLLSWWVTWWHVGRHGAGDGAESFTSQSPGSRKNKQATVGLAWVYQTSIPHCQPSHTYSNKATFSDSATPCGPMRVIFFQTTIDTLYSQMKEKEDT